MTQALTVPVPAPLQAGLDATSSALLQQLVNATAAQVSAYMTANVTTLAQTQTVLTALALGLRYVYLKHQAS